MDAIERLQEGHSGLQQQLHSIASSLGLQTVRQDVRHQQNVDRLEHVEHVLEGNGREGLVTTVTKIETVVRLLAWLVGVIMVPLVVTMITVLSDHFSKH